jgi:hypothetical protein
LYVARMEVLVEQRSNAREAARTRRNYIFEEHAFSIAPTLRRR